MKKNTHATGKKTGSSMRNERTSKKVASKSSAIMREANKRISACEMMIVMLQTQIAFINAVKSVAASALTQASDRKKKAK